MRLWRASCRRFVYCTCVTVQGCGKQKVVTSLSHDWVLRNSPRRSLVWMEVSCSSYFPLPSFGICNFCSLCFTSREIFRCFHKSNSSTIPVFEYITGVLIGLYPKSSPQTSPSPNPGLLRLDKNPATPTFNKVVFVMSISVFKR